MDKQFWLSKTVIFNVLAMLAAVFALPEITEYIAPQTAMLAQGVINIILRVWFTSKPIAHTGSSL